MKTLEQLLDEIRKNYTDAMNRAMETAEHDYNQGMTDCMEGAYSKWYRYNHSDDGAAYDLGWMTQNKTTQNETVEFRY